MKTNTRPARRSSRLACLFVAFAALATATARAQTAPAPTTPAVTKLESFVVTGSLIPIAAGSTAVPITVIGATEIEKTGVSTDLLDVLRKSQPAFYGGNNLGSDVANINSGTTNGGSGISLRNRSTLVLINGRRAGQVIAENLLGRTRDGQQVRSSSADVFCHEVSLAFRREFERGLVADPVSRNNSAIGSAADGGFVALEFIPRNDAVD